MFLFQPAGVIAFVGDAAAAIEFENPAGDFIQEVAIMGDGHDGAWKVVEEALEPSHRFRDQMVGRLVEQQHVRA